MNAVMSRLGARLSNWNDRARPDTRSDRTRRYRVVDALAGWLYVRGDRPTTEYMECGCEMVRCENPDCREPIYATDGVCRACAGDTVSDR